MKARLMFVLMALMTSVAFGSTTLTINVSSFTGGTSPGASIRIDLQNCANAHVTGTGQVVPQTQTIFPINGIAVVTLFSNTDPAGGGQILCQVPGGPTATSYYSFNFIYQGVITSVGSYNLIPGTFNLSDLTPCVGPACIGNGSGQTMRIIAGTNITITPTSGLGNVTINSSGGGGAGNPAGPSFALNFANSGVTSFQGDPTLLFNTTLKNMVGGVNSEFDSDAFVTGSGNNGVLNLQQGPQCNQSTPGCTMLFPFGSTSTEDPYASELIVPNSILIDRRLGYQITTSINPQTVPGTTTHSAQQATCVLNAEPLTVSEFGYNSFCDAVFYFAGDPGKDSGGVPSVHVAQEINPWFYVPGIHQALSLNPFFEGGDDAGGMYINWHGHTNRSAGSSEGNLIQSIQGFEEAASVGAVVTGGHGATTIKTTLSATHGINLPVDSINEVYSSGYITGQSQQGSNLPNVTTTSDTHAVSSAVVFTTQACGSAVTQTQPASIACTYTTSGGSGQLCVLGLWNGSSCVGTTPVAVAVGDYANPECVTISAVGGGSVTMGLTLPHASGTVLEQGASSCSTLQAGQGGTIAGLQGDYFNNWIVGARTSTSYDTIYALEQQQNGKISIPILNFSTGVASASRTGTTVTLQMAAGAYFWNGITPAELANATLCLAGNTSSGLNVCDPTATTVVTNNGTTITYTSATSGTASGTGGTLKIVDAATNNFNAFSNYQALCGANLIRVLGITAENQFGGDSSGVSVVLSPNNCTWATNAPLAQPNAQNQQFNGQRVSFFAGSANPAGANTLNQWSMQGAAFSGGVYVCGGCESFEPLNRYLGYGGFEGTRVFAEIADPGVSLDFQILNAPIGPSGTVMSIGPIPAGGYGQTAYTLISMSGATTFTNLNYDTVADSLSMVSSNPAASFVVPALAARGWIMGPWSFDPGSYNSLVLHGDGGQFTSDAIVANPGSGSDPNIYIDFINAGVVKYRATNSAGTGQDFPLIVADTGVTATNLTVTGTCTGCSSGVSSINTVAGAFTFSFSSGAGSCSGTTCTFTGSGSGGGSVTNFVAASGSWPAFLVPSVATSTTTPTLSVSLANQSANAIFAGPGSGSAAAPTFRALVSADLPAISFSSLTSGTNTTGLVVGSGGVLSFVSGGFINANEINGVALSGLASGPLCNTTATGVPSICGAINLAGTGAGGVTGNLPNANLASQTANTVLGALTATTPSGLALPSCSASTSALTWTSGTGFGCHTISAGSAVWSSLTNPTGNLSLSMTSNTSTFTWGSATSTPDLFKKTDTTGNTGTGILDHDTTASGSTEIPWQADANGVGWKVDASGNFGSVGTTASGTIQLSGSSSGTANLTVAAAAGTPTLTLPTATGTLTETIASGTSALGTSSISSATCATVVTTTATGVTATDAIAWTPNGSIKAVTGYAPSTSGGLTIAAYPTSGNVNFDVCNWTSSSITPGAVTLNWQVTR